MQSDSTIEIKDERDRLEMLELPNNEKGSVKASTNSVVDSAVLRQQMKVREIMQPKRLIKTLSAFAVFLTLYLVLLKFNIDEAKLRTISSKYSSFNSMEPSATTGLPQSKLEVNVRVLKADLVDSLIICQISFLPSRAVSNDIRRLNTPLLAYFGYHQRIYSVNSTMEPIIATFPILLGSNNYYPLDEFYTEISVEITDLNTGQRIPTVVRIKASVPALHFAVAGTVQELEGGDTSETKEEAGSNYSNIDGEVENYSERSVQSYRFKIKISRPFTLILFSFLIIILMWALSLSMAVLAINIVIGLDARPECSFLGQGSALLFALPRLRNVQPDVPPIGIIIDGVGFYWNMAIAGMSFAAVLMIWMVRRDYTATYK
ncbi:hypothetical protein DSO57_1034315 [Entomophthora muscae]|uniref:Uncharacterized protein n=1 Tax=Entomophthora muscae TaxID=34485 RepID=A0ACC2SPM4_9FUNG|nr:hypothetical protein DSO57_1034315 [Entomophthora muscae]